jgi:peptidoglycan/LPS O-acetylase OafA/YrhL
MVANSLGDVKLRLQSNPALRLLSRLQRMNADPFMPALTGLRFFLAGLVMLFHVAGKQMKDAPAWVGQIVGHGYLTVNAFFILSGFVLAHTYLDPSGRLKGSRRNFWTARFARIYPVYALTILLIFPYRFDIGMNQPKGSEDALASMMVFTLAQAWVPAYALLINSAAWSLSAEAFFYLCFPVLSKFDWNRTRRGLIAVIAICWLLSLSPPTIAWIAFHYGGPRLADLLTKTWVNEFLLYNPLFHFPAFVMGVAAQRLFLLESSGPMVHSRWPAAMSVLSIGLICLILAMGWPIPRLYFNNGLLAPAFACLIFALASGRGAVARILGRPPMVLLGEASYSLYLLHLPLWALTLALNGHTLHLADFSWGFLFLDIAVAVAVSLVALRYVEKPYRNSINKALRRPVLPAES